MVLAVIFDYWLTDDFVNDLAEFFELESLDNI